MEKETNTSPSLHHLGHYKCLITSDGNKLYTKLKDLTLSILQLHNIILNNSITSGTPLNCWMIIEVMMIQLEPNNPKINKLRFLHKFEADYNLLLKYRWLYKTTHYDENIFLVKTNWVPVQEEVPIQLPL